MRRTKMVPGDPRLRIKDYNELLELLVGATTPDVTSGAQYVVDRHGKKIRVDVPVETWYGVIRTEGRRVNANYAGYIGVPPDEIPEREPDYADARYHVWRARATCRLGDPDTSLVTFEAIPEDEPGYKVVTATNLSELFSDGTGGSHALVEGTIVKVQGFWTFTTKGPVVRYTFEKAMSSVLTPFMVMAPDDDPRWSIWRLVRNTSAGPSWIPFEEYELDEFGQPTETPKYYSLFPFPGQPGGFFRGCRIWARPVVADSLGKTIFMPVQGEHMGFSARITGTPTSYGSGTGLQYPWEQTGLESPDDLYADDSNPTGMQELGKAVHLESLSYDPDEEPDRIEIPVNTPIVVRYDPLEEKMVFNYARDLDYDVCEEA